MDKIKFIFRYVRYLFLAKGKNAINSPYVLDLYSRVILPDKYYYAFDEIDAIRQMLENNEKTIFVTDFGAGSKFNNDKEKRISDIAKNAAKSKKIGKLMTALTNHFQPQNGIELGTSLGISMLYQYSGAPKANWVTFEGCKETAKVAKKVFQSFKAPEIKVVVGDFNKTLNDYLINVPKLDYVFFDGNHQKQATLDYFDCCLNKAHEGSLFIFDDIHWSSGMEEAWEIIKSHPRVTTTIDLFWIGLVFFKADKKKHFLLRF